MIFEFLIKLQRFLKTCFHYVIMRYCDVIMGYCDVIMGYCDVIMGYCDVIMGYCVQMGEIFFFLNKF